MSPQEAAARAGRPVGRLGQAFMFDPATAAVGAGHGLDPWGLYYVGRAGVLGDAHPAVVAAALVFFPPAMAEKGWRKGRAVLTPDAAVRVYAEACRAWGRRTLAGAADLDRLVVLARRVVAAADGAALPLFAGWRAVPVPADDLPGAAAQLLHVLREHRGGVHGLAVVASGLRPLEAIVSGPHGPGNARFFGWPEPWPDAEPLAERRAAAEALTDALAAPAWAALDVAEREELVGLVEELSRGLAG